MGVNDAVLDRHPTVERTADHALLTPHLALAKLPVGEQAGQFRGRARAARRTIVRLAGTQHEIPMVSVVKLYVVDLGITACIHGLPDRPGIRRQCIQILQSVLDRRIVHQEEPVAAPRDVTRHLAISWNFERHILGLAVTGDIVNGHLIAPVQLRFNDADRRFNPMDARRNPAQMRQRHGQPDRPVPAHLQVPDIVEEDDSRRATCICGFAQQGPDECIRRPRFTGNRSPIAVEITPEDLHPVAQAPGAEVRSARDHHPSRLAPGVRIDDVNSVGHRYNIALSETVFDAVVVGAGIVGAACARELARAGLHVAVCEASGMIGGGATAAGMGHLAVMDDSDPQFALTSYSQALWSELAPQLPPDAEYLPCGSLWLAADDEEMAEVYRKFAFYQERNIAVEVLDAKQLAEAEPNLRRGLAGALRMPSDSVIYAPCAARWLLEGIPVFLGHQVSEFTDEGVEFANGHRFAAGSVILATGTAITRALPWVPVQPRKGHLLITDRYPGFLHHQLIELGYLKSAHSVANDSVAFNAQPRATGQILIGSSRQFGTEDSTVEQDILSRMLARAIEYMPGLPTLSAIRAWTGFRAATPDKLPLIGLCPGHSNVYLATGHEGLGISTSLATGRLIADHILGRLSAIPREPYLPGRSFDGHD
ncbi:MAG: dependent oxidoreductase [Bryobacterales bacterium]|nr:dependent oxidoreductase [Bryobacterales bacterium]